MKEALKLALEALESDYTFEWPAMHRPERAEKKRFEAITAIKAALAQPAQVEHCEAGPARCPVCAKEAAQEPDELTIAYMSGLYDGKKKRPWVGLTDEEASWCQAPSTIQTWKRIEAKLKGKNT